MYRSPGPLTRASSLLITVLFSPLPPNVINATLARIVLHQVSGRAHCILQHVYLNQDSTTLASTTAASGNGSHHAIFTMRPSNGNTCLTLRSSLHNEHRQGYRIEINGDEKHSLLGSCKMDEIVFEFRVHLFPDTTYTYKQMKCYTKTKCVSAMEYDAANARYAGVHQATSEALR